MGNSSPRQFGVSYLLPFISLSAYVGLSKRSLNFKAVYLDECHSLLYSHANWLEQYDEIIVGLTGTPPRFSLSEKGQMVERYCPLVYTYFTDDAVLDGILNDYRIIVHHLKLDVEKTIKVVQQNTGRVWYTSEWEAYRYCDKRIELSKQETSPKDVKWLRLQRMRVLMGFPSKVTYTQQLLRETTNKTIAFANTKQQAEEICSYSYHTGNSQSKINLDLFVRGEIPCLSSVAQLNEG